MRFSEAVMWGDSFIQNTLKYREMRLRDFVKVVPNFTDSLKTLKSAIFVLPKYQTMLDTYPQVNLRKVLLQRLVRVLPFI